MARRALILANGTFEDGRIVPLASPVPDAKRLTDLLRREEVGGYEVSVCSDLGAQRMRLAVEQFFRSGEKGDFLMLFLSGHGFKDSEGNLVFAASDTDKDWLESTGVPARFINKQASKTRASLSIFLIDSCYSGAFTKGHVFKKGDAGIDREDFSIPGGHGTAIITASSSVQLAGEAEANGSIQSHFTRHFIEGIETGKADRGKKGHISLDDLFVYVRNGLKQTAPGQTPKPHYFGVDGSEEVARNPVWKPVQLPEELLKELRDPDRRVRGAAAEALAEIVREGGDKALLARKQLQRLTSDDSKFVRNLADELLQEFAEDYAMRIKAEAQNQKNNRAANEVDATEQNERELAGAADEPGPLEFAATLDEEDSLDKYQTQNRLPIAFGAIVFILAALWGLSTLISSPNDDQLEGDISSEASSLPATSLTKAPDVSPSVAWILGKWANMKDENGCNAAVNISLSEDGKRLIFQQDLEPKYKEYLYQIVTFNTPAKPPSLQTKDFRYYYISNTRIQADSRKLKNVVFWKRCK